MKKLVVVAASFCALVLAGSAAALSPAAYRKQANTICLDMNRKIDRLASPSGPKQVLPFLKKGLAIALPAATRLRRLVPPKSLAADHARVHGLIANSSTLLRQLVARLEAGANPEQAVRAADPALTRLANREEGIWRRMGIPQCAEGS